MAKKEAEDEITQAAKKGKSKITEDSPIKNPFFEHDICEDSDDIPSLPVFKKEKKNNNNNNNNDCKNEDEDEEVASSVKQKVKKTVKTEDEDADHNDKEGEGEGEEGKEEEEDEEKKGVKPLHVMEEGEEVSYAGDSGTDHKYDFLC